MVILNIRIFSDRIIVYRALSNKSRAKMISKLTACLRTVLVVLAVFNDYSCADYIIDDSVGLGRMFNGIGGLSGGGVSYQLHS